MNAIRAADAGWLKAFTARDFNKSVSFCDEHASMLVPNAPIVTRKKSNSEVDRRWICAQGLQA